MSIPRVQTITCPNCGRQFNVTFFESINTDFAPDVAESVISGERFKAECPACGYIARLEYDVLYHDIQRRVMIYVLHPQIEDFAKKADEIKTAPIPDNYTTRMVSSIDALREKVSCLETDLDDRVVEVCKVLLNSQLISDKPGFHPIKSFYRCFDGTQIVTFLDKDGQEVNCSLEAELYQKVFHFIKGPLQKMDNGSFITIDSTWAQKLINSLPIESPEKEKDNSSQAIDVPEETNPTDHPSKPVIKRCPHCNHSIPGDSEFCQYCGTNLVVNGKDAGIPLPECDNDNQKSAAACIDSDVVSPTVRASDLARGTASPLVDRNVTATSAQDSSEDQLPDNTDHNNTRYCKLCGGEIDNDSRKCKKCGKQYLKTKTTLPILLLSVLSLCLIGVILIQFFSSKKLLSRMHELEEIIEQKESSIGKLNTSISNLETSIEQKDSRISTQKNRINEIQDDLEKASELARDYDRICKALRIEELGYASDNFCSSEKVVYVDINQTDRKFTLTAYWTQGGTVSVEYLPSARPPTAEVRFDNNSWNTSTTLTVVPKSKGVTLVVFYNDIDDDYFPVLIIVGDQEE